MKSISIKSSPQFYARTAGFLYIIVIAGGIFAQVFVLQKLVVIGDPESTAVNILNNESFFRFGIAVHLTILICALIILSIFYVLLNALNKIAAYLMAFFDIVSISIEAFSLLYLNESLNILKSGTKLSLINSDLLYFPAYTALRMQSPAYDLALVFFGFFCIFAGYLIIKSTFLPRLLGLLMIIAGLCYITNSFIHFIAPQHSLFPYIVMPSFIAELSLTLWLIFKGINIEKWNT